MALCVAPFSLLKCGCSCCTAITTDVLVPPRRAAALPVCRWGWRDLGSAGQGTGFGAAVPGEALGVTRCSLPCCLFLSLSHGVLVVACFRLVEDLCSVWNYVFVLSHILIENK